MDRTVTLCTVCEWREATRAGRCDACYMFRRRKDRDKTEDEVVLHATRAAEARWREVRRILDNR